MQASQPIAIPQPLQGLWRLLQGTSQPDRVRFGLEVQRLQAHLARLGQEVPATVHERFQLLVNAGKKIEQDGSKKLKMSLRLLADAWPPLDGIREVTDFYFVGMNLSVNGGTCDIYHGWHKEANLKVAIKVVAADRLTDPFQRKMAPQMLEEEYRILKSLPTGYGSRCYGWMKYKGQPCIVMEYLEGRELGGVVDDSRHAHNSISDFGRLIGTVAKVVAKVALLHKIGIVHQDLKFENLMYDRERVTVLDIGIALKSGSTNPKVIGTPNYMSPESCYENSVADPRRDVFALGALLYYFLTGTFPFEAEEPMETMLKILTEAHEPPSTRLVADYPYLEDHIDIVQKLDQIVMKALEKKPEDRYHNASEMLQALREVLDAIEAKTLGDAWDSLQAKSA